MQQEKYQKGRRGAGFFKKLLMFLLVLVLLAVAAYGGYLYRDKKAKDDAKSVAAATIAANQTLKATLTKLQKDLAAAKKSQSSTSTSTSPSAATLENITAAVKSGNYAALQSLMAPTVKVTIAASEGVGNRTPAQAVSDLKYLDAGTDPWNFSLSAATLSDYRTGDYKAYFPSGAHVGESANKYVVSFQFNTTGKISGVFMAANSDLL